VSLAQFFREDRLEVQHDLLRAHPLGLIITGGTGGLMATPVPCVLHAGEGERGTLRAHFARGNAQWKELSGASECLVVFQGAQHYITPSWYPTKKATQKAVPTWNYVVVHVWGTPRVVQEAAWLRGHLEALTDAHERARPEPWKVADAPEDYLAAMMRAIVGIEIPIARIEGKWKVSQNRPDVDRVGVVEGLRAEGGSAEMADLVEQRSPG